VDEEDPMDAINFSRVRKRIVLPTARRLSSSGRGEQISDIAPAYEAGSYGISLIAMEDLCSGL
jgi:hypothetical protein